MKDVARKRRDPPPQTRTRRFRRFDSGRSGLAAAGLAAHIAERLPFTLMLPAVGQGALALETRGDDTATRRIAAADHPSTHAAVLAERAMLARLQGGCLAPVAGLGLVEEGRLTLIGRVLSQDGTDGSKPGRRPPPPKPSLSVWKWPRRCWPKGRANSCVPCEGPDPALSPARWIVGAAVWYCRPRNCDKKGGSSQAATPYSCRSPRRAIMEPLAPPRGKGAKPLRHLYWRCASRCPPCFPVGQRGRGPRCSTQIEPMRRPCQTGRPRSVRCRARQNSHCSSARR